MLLKSLTAGKVSSTGTITLTNGHFGGALISTDGTNAVTVLVTDAATNKIFEIVTVSAGFVTAPIHSTSKALSYSVTGTGGYAQFYEWVPRTISRF